jgi:hypothetical protein
MLSMIITAMPNDLYDAFLKPDSSAGYTFVRRLESKFDSETCPS